MNNIPKLEDRHFTVLCGRGQDKSFIWLDRFEIDNQPFELLNDIKKD